MRASVVVFISAIVLGAVPAVKAQNTISGTPRVMSATSMMVAGKPVRLAHVRSVAAPTPCVWKNRKLDCGKLAKAGLQDLVVASQVSCTKAQSAGYVCRAGGYDLAYGLVHAGWAVPLADAPPSYKLKAKDAQKRRVGLWSATTMTGKLVARSLK